MGTDPRRAARAWTQGRTGWAIASVVLAALVVWSLVSGRELWVVIPLCVLLLVGLVALVRQPSSG